MRITSQEYSLKTKIVNLKGKIFRYFMLFLPLKKEPKVFVNNSQAADSQNPEEQTSNNEGHLYLNNLNVTNNKSFFQTGKVRDVRSVLP